MTTFLCLHGFFAAFLAVYFPSISGVLDGVVLPNHEDASNNPTKIYIVVCIVRIVMAGRIQAYYNAIKRYKLIRPLQSTTSEHDPVVAK